MTVKCNLISVTVSPASSDVSRTQSAKKKDEIERVVTFSDTLACPHTPTEEPVRSVTVGDGPSPYTVTRYVRRTLRGRCYGAVLP